MTYYKIVRDDTVIDANSVFMRWQERNGLLLLCTSKEAELVCSYDGETYYHLPWLKPVSPSMQMSYEEADGQIISEAEYLLLRESLDAGQAPLDDEVVLEDAVDVIEVISETDAEFEALRERKQQTLSQQCQQAIVNGLDITLSDGQVYHFRLRVVDQLNLDALRRMAERGASPLLYRIPGSVFIEVTAEDVETISNAVDDFILQQRRIYSDLCGEVLATKTVEALNAITYPQETT